MYQIIIEGKAKIKIPIEKKISKKLPVFYNPVMKLNRDLSVLLLNSIDKNNMQIADILAGTGVRSIRFILELKKNKIKSIIINDYSKNSIKIIKQNIKNNKLNNNKNIKITNKDANLLLLESTGFDYIDIDPFGTPNPYLDSAVKRIARDGILAVTATDTGALAGTFPDACLRKYWAVPLKNKLMHEIGLRILIRKIQLIASQYEKALIPIFSYSKEHYMRVFLRCKKGKKEVDKVLKQHGFFSNAGPIWLGKLWDEKLTEKMLKNNEIKENENLLKIIKEESKIDAVGFYDIHKICKRYKIQHIPKTDILIKKIKGKGFNASTTHFSPTGIRTDMQSKDFIKIIKNDK